MADDAELGVPMTIPVIGGAALIAFALIVTLTAKVTGVGATLPIAIVPVETKELAFDVRPGGITTVTDVASPSKVHVADPAKGQGFVQIAVESITRERAALGLNLQAPLRLLRQADGRLWLEDPTTNRRLALDAFGPVSARAFAQFLDEGQNIDGRKATP